MAAIVDMIVNLLVTELTAACQTNVDEDDITRAGLVRGGQLQESPEEYVVTILVHYGDPTDDGWCDEQVRRAAVEAAFDRMPLFGDYQEIGGGYQMLRRFTIEIECFFGRAGLTRDQAREAAATVQSRVMKCLCQAGALGGIEDDFGECVWSTALHSTRMGEGGGPPADFIWRGKVRVEYLTHVG